MNVWLPIVVFLPMLAAIVCFQLFRRSGKAGWWLLILTTLVEFAICILLFISAADGRYPKFSMPGASGLGLTFRADGFRALYALIASVMWLMTSLFSPQYFAHGHKKGRYALFTLLTQGATIGVFLSDDLFTSFLFFEIMSFTSYPWVAHEENPSAMRAAQTYLAIAVFGGMAMLMGLMLLKPMLGTLEIEGIRKAAEELKDKSSLYLPGALILTGFGAKAGMFPLHVWLPKAHPVAPAPASAMLSGILTKVGIYGILVISTGLFLHDPSWGNVLLILGCITMFTGALLALFSIDLKRTLACSSMSQIGFILIGVSMQGLLGEHNALAAQGTILHMVNHSLIKLTLFMCAGAVYMDLHKLNLNEIRGYGRNRPLLHLFFVIGAASISGVPMFSGYISKTLLHESLLEYIALLLEHGHSAFPYQMAETLFVVTGGMTLAYMLKLYIAIFWERGPGRAHMEGTGLNVQSALALGVSASFLIPLGIFPARFMTPLANLSLPFLHAHAPEHAVQYFAYANLMGTFKSLAIGIVLYLLVVRRLLMVRQSDGLRLYMDRWPAKADLENAVYRPGLSMLTWLGERVSRPADRLMDRWILKTLGVIGPLLARPADLLMDRGLLKTLGAVGLFFSRLAGGIFDSFFALLGKTVFRQQRELPPPPIGNRVTYALGRLAYRLMRPVSRMIKRTLPAANKYVYLFASFWSMAGAAFRRVTRSLSFSLMMFAIGLTITLVYLLSR